MTETTIKRAQYGTTFTLTSPAASHMHIETCAYCQFFPNERFRHVRFDILIKTEQQRKQKILYRTVQASSNTQHQFNIKVHSFNKFCWDLRGNGIRTQYLSVQTYYQIKFYRQDKTNPRNMYAYGKKNQ